ncbi:hypothetical protein F4808DRAFT_448223 [Astrocystis sublimbata]|nr:hypothetical protein F4808DRAFT_448223 [Astrocystis sublimbata]
MTRRATKIPAWAYYKKNKSLWESRICDFAALKGHLQTPTTYVSFDIESNPDGLITDIGMAYLPSVCHERPTNIQNFARHHSVFFCCLEIDSPTIRNSNLRRSSWRRRERLACRDQRAANQKIESTSAEAKMIEFIEYARGLSQTRHLTLIGFAMGAEFNVLLQQVSAVIQYISAWVDIQPIIWEVDSLAEDLSHQGIPTHLPSLVDSMAGFAFQSGFQARKFQHRASNDAVRILALFTCLAHTPMSGCRLGLEALFHDPGRYKMTINAARRRRKGTMLRGRRFIKRHHISSATVGMMDNGEFGSEIRTPIKVEQFFSKYTIQGVSRLNKGRRCRRYYVCLSNEDERDKFIRENDQKALKCGRTLRVRKTALRYKPVDREATVSSRKENREKNAKDQEDGLGFDFISCMENMAL